MTHRVVAIVSSLAILTMAAFSRVPTYRFAPLFLFPVVWAIYFLRNRLRLNPIHTALIYSAILLHMLGAFGFYQKWPAPISFDIVVHYWFALVVTVALHQALRTNFPLKTWQLNVMTFMFMMGLASLHEVMEYGSYLVLGEQGMLKEGSYRFDTSRDLLNNLLGTLTAMAVLALTTPRGR